MKKKSVHFRRCHVCGELSQRQGQVVDRCDHCDKPMAPFYFFEDSAVRVYSADHQRPQPVEGEPLPVRGLTAHW